MPWRPGHASAARGSARRSTTCERCFLRSSIRSRRWRWIAEIQATFDRFEVRPSDFRDLGDRVLALGAIGLQGKASHIEIEQPMGWLLELRGGKLIRMFFYSSHAEALEAAGLLE